MHYIRVTWTETLEKGALKGITVEKSVKYPDERTTKVAIATLLKRKNVSNIGAVQC